MSNTTFTMRHYNPIHALIKSTIDGFKADSNMISDEDISYIAGMQVLHDELGAMFKEDNPTKFKPELWKL
jgi:hypothetical protein